jgi:YtcA family
MKDAIVAGTVLCSSGCGVVPSVNILGSFFPAWLISIVIGVVLTVLTRQAFLMTKIAPYLRHAALMYPCLILLWTLATWLVVFAS